MYWTTATIWIYKALISSDFISILYDSLLWLIINYFTFSSFRWLDSFKSTDDVSTMINLVTCISGVEMRGHMKKISGSQNEFNMIGRSHCTTEERK